QALFLLLPGHVEKELERHGAVACEMALKGVDVLVALFPNVLGDELGRQAFMRKHVLMHAHHKDLFVIGAVENADMATSWQHDHRPPEKIMVELELTRR